MEFLDALGYGSWVIHFLLWFPLVGMALVLASPTERARHVAFGVALIEFVVSIPLWFLFSTTAGEFQFGSAVPWIPDWGIY